MNLRKSLRRKIVQVDFNTQSSYSHIGSCLSCIDILIEIYFHQMKKNDQFILSKGHASLDLYVILNYQKKISDDMLNTYLKENTLLGVHPTSNMPKHIPLATGSLGHGLSFSAGLAMGYKMKYKKNAQNVYCMMSDGECNEGAVWEAALFSARHKLDNIIAIIDKNRIQAFDYIHYELGDAASSEKLRSFGFDVTECDGHDLKDLNIALSKAKKSHKDKPHLIIANTVRGKGINSIENDIKSNYVVIDEKLLNESLIDIEKI